MSDQGLPPNSEGNGMIPVDGDGGDATCTACGDFHKLCEYCDADLGCYGKDMCEECAEQYDDCGTCEGCGLDIEDCQCDDDESEDDDE